jgi:membrane protein implicated in regulation of membrane protease activity
VVDERPRILDRAPELSRRWAGRRPGPVLRLPAQDAVAADGGTLVRPGGWWWVAGYVVGALIAGRIAYVANVPEDGHDDEGAAVFVGVFVALFWPAWLGLALALAPVAALVWLITRPTRAQRAARRERDATLAGVEAQRLAREFNLPDGAP